jgi:hypothetical protein
LFGPQHLLFGIELIAVNAGIGGRIQVAVAEGDAGAGVIAKSGLLVQAAIFIGIAQVQDALGRRPKILVFS